MTAYVYGNQQVRFGLRDERPPNDPEKIVRGAQMDAEFDAITTGKLDKSGIDFTGSIQDPTATVDGGTYS